MNIINLVEQIKQTAQTNMLIVFGGRCFRTIFPTIGYGNWEDGVCQSKVFQEAGRPHPAYDSNDIQ